jgi:hypothetical protein
MARLVSLTGLILIVASGLNSQAPERKAPAIYPSTPGSKATFVYIPRSVAVASGAAEPTFDRKTAESFKQHCPDVRVLALPKEADYLVFYSEWSKRDATVVRNDGEVVWAGSSFWQKKSVIRKACAAIMDDWTKKQQKLSKPQ